MQVINHRLAEDDGTPVRYEEAVCQGEELTPVFLVMHYTAANTLQSTISTFAGEDAKSSAHLVIGRDGTVVQMVPFNAVAWHAGKSRWEEYQGLNHYSLGIEMVNGGKLRREDDEWIVATDDYRLVIPEDEVVSAVHKLEDRPTGWHVYPQVQIDKAVEVARALQAAYNFQDIVGHDDIAGYRGKRDPGPVFPFEDFKSRVLQGG